MEKRENDIERLAMEHCQEFLETASWEDIMEKYAYVENAYFRYNDQVIEYLNRKALPSQDIKDNFSYYGTYEDILGGVIAANVLSEEGYQKDKNGLWILKNPLPEAPIKPQKKKFGLFK